MIQKCRGSPKAAGQVATEAAGAYIGGKLLGGSIAGVIQLIPGLSQISTPAAFALGDLAGSYIGSIVGKGVYNAFNP